MHPLQRTSWHPLPLSSPIRSAPPLLIQTHFTSSSYTVHLTDLTQVWSESLSKREILSRAEKENTSIDPSGDAGQLRILLQKLEKNLVKADNDADVELASLQPKNGQRTGELRLKTIYVLPSPLRMLVWTFRLKPMENMQFTNLFVLPLIGLAALHKEQIENLVSTVHDKDVIISKLMDQLEGVNVDIRSVLGGGRARRRGLEKFEVERWREDYSDGGERRVGEVVKDVFSSGMEETGGVKALGEEADNWWRSMEGSEDEDEEAQKPSRDRESSKSVGTPSSLLRNIGKGRARETPKKIEMPVERKQIVQGSETEDGEFEVQKTSPTSGKIPTFRSVTPVSGSSEKKKPSSPTPPPPSLAGKDADETTDDGNLDDPPPPRKVSSLGNQISASLSSATLEAGTPNSSPSPPPKAKSKIGKIRGIGTIGGSRVLARKTKSPTPPPKEYVNNGAETEDDEDMMVGKGKATGERSDSDNPSLLETRDKPSPAPLAGDSDSELEAKRKPKKIGVIRGIGKIGGKKSVPKPQHGDDEEKIVESKKTSRHTSVFVGSPARIKSPSPQPSPKEKTAASAEDEDAKADRKRRHLEKELEAKKKAPVKKRKF